MVSRLTPIIGFVVAILAAAGPAVFAQTAPPTLERVSPTGAPRGTRVTIAIQGTNIAGATRLIFSEPGFTSSVTSIEEVPIEKPPMVGSPGTELEFAL